MKRVLGGGIRGFHGTRGLQLCYARDEARHLYSHVQNGVMSVLKGVMSVLNGECMQLHNRLCECELRGRVRAVRLRVLR